MSSRGVGAGPEVMSKPPIHGSGWPKSGLDRDGSSLRRIGALLGLPVIGVAVIAVGIGLAVGLPNNTSVVGWNVAWAGFDIALGFVIIATWLLARRGSIWAIAAAGAMNAFQAVDIWFSLTMFYSLRERPGILVWAVVFQPLFAYFTWRFVLRRCPHARVPPTEHGGPRA